MTFEDLAAALATQFPIERVILFGSIARGDHGARSDADLLVIVPDSPLPPPERSAPFIRHFAAAGIPADVLVWTSREWRDRLARSDRFAVRIASEGVALWPEPNVNLYNEVRHLVEEAER